MSNRTGNVLLAAAVAAGGLYVINEGIPACISERTLGACLPNVPSIGLPDGGETKAHFGDLQVKSETLTGISQLAVYGEASVMVGGDKSQGTFDYNAHRSNPIANLRDNNPGVDATLYFNKDSKGAWEVRYNPCIKVKGDYASTPITDPSHPQPPAPAVPAGEQAPITYSVNTDDDGSILSVNIEAGYLDACFVRSPNTPANQSLWTYNKGGVRNFGASEEATFRQQQQLLIEDTVAAQACPEKIVDIEAIKKDIGTTVLGQLSVLHPEAATALAKAYRAGKFTTNIQDAIARQDHYKAILESDRSKILQNKKSFPDAHNHGKQYGIETPSLGQMNIVSCGTATPIQVKASGQ